MMFYFTLMYYKYRHVSFLLRLHYSHQAAVPQGYSLTGSKDDLGSHPRSLEISVKSSICNTYPSFCMVTYIDIVEDENYIRLITRTQ